MKKEIPFVKYHIFVQGMYYGYVKTTREEIRKRFPYSMVYPIGNAVEVWGKPLSNAKTST